MLSRFLAFAFLFLIFTNSSNAQKVFINPGVDTTDLRINKVVHFYQQYVADFKEKKLPDFNKYWSVENCKDF
jgi:hypothetical protein